MAEFERIVMVTESLYWLVCHRSGMCPSSHFNIAGLEKAPSARAEGICSFLSAPHYSMRVHFLPPSGATLIEFKSQSMLQSNCIVNQCLSEPRQWSGPSSRCAARDVQRCNLLSERLHWSDPPRETDLRTLALMQTHYPEA